METKLRFTRLKDNPELVKEINAIIPELNRIVSSDSHLADIGLGLSFLAKKIEAASKRCFKLHDEQKIVKV